MIEAISHLIHRDYEAIVADFVTLQFIPKGTDLRPILPVLAKVGWMEGGLLMTISRDELILPPPGPPAPCYRCLIRRLRAVVPKTSTSKSWQLTLPRSRLTTPSASRPTLPSSSAQSACSRGLRSSATQTLPSSTRPTRECTFPSTYL